MCKKTITMFIFTVLLAGCAHPKIVWNKPDTSEQEFNQDVYECTQETSVSWSGGGYGNVGLIMMASSKSQAQKQANELFKMCMRARGYVEQEVQE